MSEQILRLTIENMEQEYTAMAQQYASLIAQMSGLLQTAVDAHKFKKSESDHWDSVTLHSTWFDAARELLEERKAAWR